MNVPDKCITCSHALSSFEEVHKGWCKFQYEAVVRCDCAPDHPKVGCVVAEVTCAKNREDFFNDTKRHT